MAKLVVIIERHHQIRMMLMIVFELRGILLINLFPILFCLKTVELIVIVLIVFFFLSGLLVVIRIWSMSQSNGSSPGLKIVPLLLFKLQGFGDFLVLLNLKDPLQLLGSV